MYEELIKKLRNRRVCVQIGGDLEQDYPLMREAADAAEELLAWHNADMRELGRQKSLIANVRPVVRGKWEAIDFHTVKCSKCGFDMDIMEVSDHVLNHANFCPNCGASMANKNE